MTSRTYTVTGMTCGHCEQAIRFEVSAVAGVTEVAVDHVTGRLEVAGEAEEAAVLAAVAEAGYAAIPPV